MKNKEDVTHIQKLTSSMDGFLSQNGKNLREGEVLFHLARKIPKKGTIVEIGSWKGKSTIWLGKGAEKVKELLDLVFIDGRHDYQSVNHDFKTWFPKVKEGGMMAFHDSFVGWPGVQKVVHRQVFRSPYFKKVRYINSITYAVKTPKASFLERIENYFFLGVKKIHQVSLIFPQPLKSFIKKLVWRPCQRKWLMELED